MPDEGTFDYEPGVLRVLQTKSETKAFYDKIAKVYDLLSEHSERPVREAGLRLLAACMACRAAADGSTSASHSRTTLNKAVIRTAT